MVYIDGVKYACDRCIRGHRVSTCQHTDQKLTMIKPKGRPISQCAHCRENRKSRLIHTKCLCGSSGEDHATDCPCAVDKALCICVKKKVTTTATRRTASNPPPATKALPAVGVQASAASQIMMHSAHHSGGHSGGPAGGPVRSASTTSLQSRRHSIRGRSAANIANMHGPTLTRIRTNSVSNDSSISTPEEAGSLSAVSVKSMDFTFDEVTPATLPAGFYFEDNSNNNSNITLLSNYPSSTNLESSNMDGGSRIFDISEMFGAPYSSSYASAYVDYTSNGSSNESIVPTTTTTTTNVAVKNNNNDDNENENDNDNNGMIKPQEQIFNSMDPFMFSEEDYLSTTDFTPVNNVEFNNQAVVKTENINDFMSWKMGVYGEMASR